MTQTLSCLAASFLVTASVSAQTPPRQEACPPLRLALATLPALQDPAPPPAPETAANAKQMSRTGRIGGLIGLGAGLAVGSIYFYQMSCPGGSDDPTFWAAVCVAPPAVMTAVGWGVGRAIGRNWARHHPKP